MSKHQEYCCGCKYDDPNDRQYRLPCHRCEMEGDNPSWYFQEEDKRKSIRARWKGAGMGDYECTNCWEVVSGGDKYNFCPWCGAYMRA